MKLSSISEIDFRKIPLKIRLLIYDYATELHLSGLNTIQIKKSIFKNFGVSVRTNTIYRWTSGRNKPFGLIRIFREEPSKELSYIIGVYLGDGNIKSKIINYQYIFSVKVKDKDFANAVSISLAKLLQKNKPYALLKFNDKTRGNRQRYEVQVGNRMLHEFLSSPLEKLLIFASKFPAEFLRGLFDSDGFTSISAKKDFTVGVGLVGTDIVLLEFVQFILNRTFKIKSGISKSVHKGSSVIIWGKKYVANKDVFSLNIDKFSDVKKFISDIGFSIKRKQEKMLDAIFMKDNFSKKYTAEIWRKSYVKIGREWVKIREVDSGGSPEDGNNQTSYGFEPSTIPGI